MKVSSLNIDIKSVIEKKNPWLAAWIPGFGYKFLRKLIHEQELNESLAHLEGKTGIAFIRGALHELGISSEVTGFDQIPEKGRFVFVSNHPLGGLDGMVMMDRIAEKFPDVRFVANDLLMNILPLRSIFLPVNKHGRQSSVYARQIREGFQSPSQILYFPAGICSRKIRGCVTDLRWNSNFIKQTIRSQRDIIPVFFEGRNSDFFYRIASLRKTLGIRANLEMAWLVDEMFRQKGSRLKIWFGKPISWTRFDASKSPEQWADWVRDLVYLLPGDKNGETKL